ncbi:MAG: hypothetical protein NTZ95_04855, partial [Candidatus Omnitrophica bacterium]|nr:hypothetical protein [Candidatus Omnitrophota bacterium]
TGFVELDVYTFYTTGKLNTKEVFDNIVGTFNIKYKKYKYAADGLTLTEEISYGTDSKWHKRSNFSGIQAQRDEVYSDIDSSGNLTGFIEVNLMAFYSDGKLQVKEIFDNLLGTKNTNYKKYTYDDAAGYPLKEEISYWTDSKWHKKSSFTATLGDGMIHAERDEVYSDIVLGDGMIHAERDEVYSDINLTTLIEVNVMTFYSTGKMKTKSIYSDVAGAHLVVTYTYNSDGSLATKTDYISNRLTIYVLYIEYPNGLKRIQGLETDFDGVSNPLAFDGYQMGLNFYTLVSGDIYFRTTSPATKTNAKLHVTIN